MVWGKGGGREGRREDEGEGCKPIGRITEMLIKFIAQLNMCCLQSIM